VRVLEIGRLEAGQELHLFRATDADATPACFRSHYELGIAPFKPLTWWVTWFGVSTWRSRRMAEKLATRLASKGLDHVAEIVLTPELNASFHVARSGHVDLWATPDALAGAVVDVYPAR
jgi:hypothetical protein